MANIRSNSEVFPRASYTGTNLSYFEVANELHSCLQVEHPATGTLSLEISVDYKNQAYADKLWSPLPVRLQGSTVYLDTITFTTTTPSIIKLDCSPYSFIRATLTGSGDFYRVIYNSPTGSV